MELEYKSTPAEFKAGEDGTYEGYFSIKGNVDDGGDIIHDGAFAKTLSERASRIKVLMYHDWSRLVGPAPEVLKEDSKGLYAKGRLSVNTFYGRETYELMKDGALNEGSIGYYTVKADYGADSGQSVRHLRELALYEISFVPLGMNPLTEVGVIKSLMGGDQADKDEAFERILRAMAGLQGQATKAGRVLSSTNLTLAKNALGAAQELADLLEKLIAAAEGDDGKAIRLALQQRRRAAELALAINR